MRQRFTGKDITPHRFGCKHVSVSGDRNFRVRLAPCNYIELLLRPDEIAGETQQLEQKDARPEIAWIQLDIIAQFCDRFGKPTSIEQLICSHWGFFHECKSTARCWSRSEEHTSELQS